jgi:outer membrane beta-barrel protein
MEVRIHILLLTVALMAALPGCAFMGRGRDRQANTSDTAATDAGSAGERAVIEPEVQRRKIKTPKIRNSDFELGAYYGIISIEDFGSDAVYGASLSYHLTEDFFLEATFGKSRAGKTSYETLSGAAQLLTSKERDYRYYALSAGWDALPGEIFLGRNRAYNTALYLLGGVGSTHFAGNEHFTVNLGAGYRILMTNWLAMHMDVRDYLFDSDLLGKKKTTNNIEARIGVSVFF